MMLMFRRSGLPERTDCIQFHRDRSPVIPRFNVIFEYLCNPGSLRELEGSAPSRYSTTSTSASRPETSVKPVMVMPSISTTKLNEPYGSCLADIAASSAPRLDE